MSEFSFSEETIRMLEYLNNLLEGKHCTEEEDVIPFFTRANDRPTNRRRGRRNGGGRGGSGGAAAIETALAAELVVSNSVGGFLCEQSEWLSQSVGGLQLFLFTSYLTLLLLSKKSAVFPLVSAGWKIWVILLK